MSWHRIGFVASLAVLGLAVATARAAEADKYLPEDTNGVISLNVRQVVDSPLFKKTYLPILQKELKAKPELQTQLKDIGFDPFKDIDRVQIAIAESCEREGGKEAGVFVVFQGRFDPAKIHTKIAVLAPHIDKALLAHKVGNNILYEFNADERSFFFALPDKNSLVFATRKEPVRDALERATGKKKVPLRYKDVQDLVTKTDAKQALWLVATGRTTLQFETVFAGPKGKKVEQMARKTLADSGVYEVSGGFWVTDGVKGAFGIKVQNEQAAKAVSEALSNELAKTIDKGFDGALATEPRLAPLREFLKEMVINGDGKHIVIQSEVPGRVFANSLK